MSQFVLFGPLMCTAGEKVGGRNDLGRCGQRVHHQGGRVEGRVLGREWQQWSPGQLVSFFEVFHVLYWTFLLIHLIIPLHWSAKLLMFGNLHRMHIGIKCFFRKGAGLDQRRGTLAREEQGSWWKDRKLPAADLLGGEENRSSGGWVGRE